MGFRIESYSLNELHRISVPGGVPPTLFWVLPIGKLLPRELDRLWHWFTQEESACHNYGLLLVKDQRPEESAESVVSLASVGTKLADIIPAGAERFVLPSSFSEDFVGLLVLSGGYPQPGWGVLVEYRGDVGSFEQLVQRANGRLADDGQFEEGLRVILEATKNFYRWRNPRGTPTRPDLDAWESEIRVAESADSLLRDVQTALETGKYSMAGEKLSEAVRGIERAAYLEIPDQDLHSLVDDQQALRDAASILAVPADVLAAEIEPKLDALIADPGTRESAFRRLSVRKRNMR